MNRTEEPQLQLSERLARLKSPEACEQFARNVEARGKPALAVEARRRAVQLRAAEHGATTKAERESLEAVYAYERTLRKKHGRNIRASRTWRMIATHGIIGSVERLVTRRKETQGYMAVVEMGMRDMAFEAVVLRHPELFSAEAVESSTQRLKELGISTDTA